MSEFLKVASREASGKRVKEYAQEIARFHRIQASPGYHEALEYVKGVLDDIGVETTVHSYVSDGKTVYAKGSTSPVGWKVTDGELWVAQPKKERIGRFLDHPTLVMPQSRPTEGWEESELVFIGSGIEERNYPKNLEGKLVLTHGRASWVHSIAVIEKGAKGLVFYKEKIPTEAFPYTATWPTSEEIGRAGVCFSISRSWAAKLKDLLEKGPVRLRYRVRSEFLAGKLEVLEGLIKGQGTKDVLLTAHLCHPKPGAHDNASGSAALLEIATVLIKLIGSAEFKPGLGIRLWWVPEFSGTIAHVSSNPDIARNLAAMLNLDMVGADQEATGGSLAVIGFPYYCPSFMPLLTHWTFERAVKTQTFYGESKTPVVRFSMVNYEDGSDHHIFADPAVGVPQTAVGEFFDRFWHTDMDVPDNLDARVLGIVAASSAATVAWISSIEGQDRRNLALLVSLEARRHAARELSGLIQSEDMDHAAARIHLMSEAYERAVLSLKGLGGPEGFTALINELAAAVRSDVSSAIVQADATKLELPEELGPVYRRLKPCCLRSRDFLRSLPRERAKVYIAEGKRGRIADTLHFSIDGKRPLAEAWRLVLAEIGGIKYEDVVSVAKDLEDADWISRTPL